MKLIATKLLIVLCIVILGLTISAGRDQSFAQGENQIQPPVDDGYIPKPVPDLFYQECPFCGDFYTFLIGKEKIAQPTLEYKYMREFLPFPTKKNPVIYVYACRDGHVWHLLRFGPPKVCAGGLACVGQVE